jgi:hypothetical protein
VALLGLEPYRPREASTDLLMLCIVIVAQSGDTLFSPYDQNTGYPCFTLEFRCVIHDCDAVLNELPDDVPDIQRLL